jgi:predicted DNA-binding transcriptional regulator AlpA
MDKEYIIHLTTDQLRDLISEQVGKVVQPLFNELSKNRKDETDIISVAEGCELLGLKIATVYTKKSRRTLPGLIKRGNRLYFSKTKLLEYLSTGTVKTGQDLIDEAVSNLKK